MTFWHWYPVSWTCLLICLCSSGGWPLNFLYEKIENSCVFVIGSFIDSIDIYLFYQSAEHFDVSRMGGMSKVCWRWPLGSDLLPVFCDFTCAVLCLVTQSCLTCMPMDCSLLNSSVYGILQAEILEWVAISFSRGSSKLWDQTWISCMQVDSLPSEAQGKPITWCVYVVFFFFFFAPVCNLQDLNSPTRDWNQACGIGSTES